jgi:hypothetical protein
VQVRLATCAGQRLRLDYLADLFSLNTTSEIDLLGTHIAWWTIGIAVVGIMLLFIPSYRGLRLGTVFATTLAMLSMIR